MKPVRKILTREDLEEFHKTASYSQLLGFLQKLNESVVGLETDNKDVFVSDFVLELSLFLDKVHSSIQHFPAAQAKSRFGNIKFKEWIKNLEKISRESMKHFDEKYSEELVHYFSSSFGSFERIDYGTGHELNFLCWLFCFDVLGKFEEADYPALVLRVFHSYVKTMRYLQTIYWLEPAGSHGVWGLDDYHFLPFLFGSSQLIDHKILKPKSIHNKEYIEEFKDKYIYFECIRFINQIKTCVSLRWHSPMLDDISTVKTWRKLNSGMFKMYKAEVLSKLPIMQHFYVGSLIKFEAGTEINDEILQEHGHCHNNALGQEFPTCCGIRIPSSISACEKTEKLRVPFD